MKFDIALAPNFSMEITTLELWGSFKSRFTPILFDSGVLIPESGNVSAFITLILFNITVLDLEVHYTKRPESERLPDYTIESDAIGKAEFLTAETLERYLHEVVSPAEDCSALENNQSRMVIWYCPNARNPLWTKFFIQSKDVDGKCRVYDIL